MSLFYKQGGEGLVRIKDSSLTTQLINGAGIWPQSCGNWCLLLSHAMLVGVNVLGAGWHYQLSPVLVLLNPRSGFIQKPKESP